MRLIILVVGFALTLGGCSNDYNSNTFDKEVWLSNSDISDQDNPRSRMTMDLIKNYLRPGMQRDSIILLLGQPYMEKVDYRLPKGLNVPDSVSNIDSIGMEKFNEWHGKFSQPDTIMRYPVGWSTIDPNFLIIKLGRDNTVADFWVEQG